MMQTEIPHLNEISYCSLIRRQLFQTTWGALMSHYSTGVKCLQTRIGQLTLHYRDIPILKSEMYYLVFPLMLNPLLRNLKHRRRLTVVPRRENDGENILDILRQRAKTESRTKRISTFLL